MTALLYILFVVVLGIASLIISIPKTIWIRVPLVIVTCLILAHGGYRLGRNTASFEVGMKQKAIELLLNQPTKEHYTNKDNALEFLKAFPHAEFIEGTGVPTEDGEFIPFTELYKIIDNQVLTFEPVGR